MKRRKFAQSVSLLTGAALACQLERSLLAMPRGSAYKDTIGLQLWTVRNQMAEDKRKTLTAVAAAGYKQVELMDTADAAELLPICRSNSQYRTELGLFGNALAVGWAAGLLFDGAFAVSTTCKQQYVLADRRRIYGKWVN